MRKLSNRVISCLLCLVCMLALFPVGTILETTNSANPSTYIGGTWELLPAGLTTISAGTYTETHNVNGTDVTDTYVFTAGSSEFTVNGTKTQGEAKHQITKGELPHLTGEWDSAVPNNYQNTCKGIVGVKSGTADGGHNGTQGYGYTISFGENQPHNNLMPLLGVYRFLRTS